VAGPALAFGFVVTRLLADGSPDPSFGGGKPQRFDPPLPAPANDFTNGPVEVGLDAAGNVYMAKRFVAGQEGELVVAKGTAGGTLDTSYATGGYFMADNGISGITTIQQQAFQAGIAVGPDGRVVVAGTSQHGTPDADLLAIALLPDGSVDPNFRLPAARGAGQIDLGSAANDFGGGGAVSPAGRVVLSGTITTSGSSANPQGLAGIGVVQLLGPMTPDGFVRSSTGTVQAGGPADGSVRVLTPTNGTYAATGLMAVFPGLPLGVRTAT